MRADMVDVQQVFLDPATSSDKTLLANLLELYIHDLSDVFPRVELGPDGRFGYDQLSLYWSEPHRRFAFLIRCDERPAGFILAMRGSPAVSDPDVFDIAEFFVLRRYRRSGVGRRAAILLWNALPGHWTVRVSRANQRALHFWSSVIAEFTNGAAAELEHPGSPNDWVVFSFESTTPLSDQGR